MYMLGVALRAHALTKIKASLEANISHLHVSSQARKGTTLWISCCMRVHNVARRSPRNQCAGNGLSEEAKITCEPRRWYIESNCVSTFSLNGNVHCSPCRCILLKSPGLTRWRSRFTEDTQISSPFRYTYTSRDLLLPHRGVRIHYLWSPLPYAQCMCNTREPTNPVDWLLQGARTVKRVWLVRCSRLQKKGCYRQQLGSCTSRETKQHSA